VACNVAADAVALKRTNAWIIDRYTVGRFAAKQPLEMVCGAAAAAS
jgi:hypothetical protein